MDPLRDEQARPGAPERHFEIEEETDFDPCPEHRTAGLAIGERINESKFECAARAENSIAFGK